MALIPKWDLGFSFRYKKWVFVIDYPKNPQQTLNKPQFTNKNKKRELEKVCCGYSFLKHASK